jgi:glycerol kinase
MAESPLILAIDSGSLEVRCTLFETSGASVAGARRGIATYLTAPDWQEQDAGQIWAAVQEGLGELAAQFDLGRVAAVGLTNQRATCLLWDRAGGDPLGPAIFRADRRSAPFMAALRDSGHELLVQITTGCALHGSFSAPKLRWMLDNLPGAGGLLAVGQLAGGTLDSWLLWQLSGRRVHATDYSNAQRTMLLNLNTLKWDSELARLFSVAPELLPQVATGTRRWGATAMPMQPRLRAPIGAIAADQTAALLGHGALAPGEAKCSYDAGIAPLMFCGERPVGAREGLAAIAYDASGAPAYAIGCTIDGGTSALEWCRTNLGVFASTADVLAQAAQAPAGDTLVFVPAFAGQNATAPDPRARAAILGLHGAADHRSIARAALESVAFQVADAMAQMHKASGVAPSRLCADGELARSDMLMQMQADLLGISVARPAQADLASLGIAYLAACGAGLPIAGDFLAAGRGTIQVFSPQLNDAGRARRMALWRAGVERAAGWAQV